MKNSIITILLIFFVSGCDYQWQCECYSPGPDSIKEDNLLMLGYLNPMTKNVDHEGKPFFTKPYSFNFVLRSKDQLPDNVLIEQIRIVGSKISNLDLLKEPAGMKMAKLNSQAFGGMKNELTYEVSNIDIDIYNQPNVQVNVFFILNGLRKELKFEFKGKLRKLSGSIV